MHNNSPKHILVTPLDWGAGHTTRCIPIISYIIARGHKVSIGVNDMQQKMLEAYFPTTETLQYLPLEGYNISYATSGRGFLPKLFSQMPRIIQTVKAEHQWLQAVVEKYKIDGIISDNRYGMYHAQLPTVFITHQLSVKTGMGRMPDALLRKLHYRFIKRFKECWVPDIATTPNLAGTLSKPSVLPSNTHYLGLLSRLEQQMSATKNDSVLVLLSGPEPQRSILSDLLWENIEQISQRVVFVEGSQSCKFRHPIPENVTYHQFLSSDALKQAIANASLVVCRSGYSTIMDLAVANKKAVFIPTPGQTEQQYLADYLSKLGFAPFLLQKNSSLDLAISTSKDYYYATNIFTLADSSFINIVDRWLQGL